MNLLRPNLILAICIVLVSGTLVLPEAKAEVAKSESGKTPSNQEVTVDSKKQTGEPASRDVRVTKSPTLISSTEAEYTQAAIDARIEGRVQLQLELDPNGNVIDVKVLKGLGYGLDEAAVAAAKTFKFTPAEINGQPAAVSFTFEIAFSLPILPSVFEGKVVDKKSGEGVAASVTIRYKKGELNFEKPPEATTETEKDGSFKFQNVPPGTYSVVVNVNDYQNFETSIDLVSGKSSTAEYRVWKNFDNLVGIVKEAGTRTPLPAVKIEVIATAEGEKDGAKYAPGDVIATAYTDAKGKFAFGGVKDKNVTLRIDSNGYTLQTVNANIDPKKVNEVELFVERQNYTEFQVTTTAKRVETSVNRRELTMDVVKRIPGNGDAVRAVQNFPGVARAPFTAGAIIVRGSAPNETGIVLDGARIPSVYHFLIGPAVVNTDLISKLDFFPGNFSVYYGNALGGIVSLETRSPKTDRIHGKVKIDVIDASALMEGPIGAGWSFALAARRSYIDAIIPLVIPKDAPIDSFVAPAYYDYQAMLAYKGLESHTFELKVYGSDDRLKVLLADKKVPGAGAVQIDGLNYSIGFVGTQFAWKWRPDLPMWNDFRGTFNYFYNTLEAGPKLRFLVKGFSFHVREDYNYQVLEWLKLRAGIEFRASLAKLTAESPRLEDDTQVNNGGGSGRPAFDRAGVDIKGSASVVDFGAYTEAEIVPFDGLVITPGFRLDYIDKIKKVAPQPRLNVRYKILDGLAVKGGVGFFAQGPSRLIRSGLVIDPETLTYQKAMHYSLGLEYTPIDFLTIDVTGFYRNLWDLVTNTNEVSVVGDGKAKSKLFANEGTGRAYGAEFLIRSRPAYRFFGWLAYTLSWAEKYFPNIGKYAPFQYDQRHILTLVAGYNFPYNIDVSLRFRLVSGTPYTPTVGGVYNSDQDKYEAVLGDAYSERFKPFHQLDLRVDKKFIFDSWILGLYLDIQNVYYAKNREGTLYNYDFSENKNLNGIPILPNIGVTGEF